MHSFFAGFCLVMAIAVSLPNVAPAQSRSLAVIDSGTFVVRRGADTVAVENFSRTAVRLRGTLKVHGKKPVKQQWSAVVSPDLTLPLIEVTVREGADTGKEKARVVQRAQVIFKDDSAAVDALTGHGMETRIYVTRVGAVPYLNLSFALLEQAVRKAFTRGAKEGEVAFFNLGGGQTASAATTRVGADSLQVRLGPTEFRLHVDATGRILGGGIPAQRLTVERVGKSS